MTDPLAADLARLPALLRAAAEESIAFLDTLAARRVGHLVPAIPRTGLPAEGPGAEQALEIFRERYLPWMSGSAGPRYLGFVTGGSTPAALVGDWLASTLDQNAADGGESATRQLALDAVGMMRELLGLPPAFDGVFVTGATASSLTALASARQWVGHARGVDVAQAGVGALGRVAVLGGTVHSSVIKGLAVTGLGREAFRAVGLLPGREAMDVAALDAALADVDAQGLGPAIVVASAGTVNSCDFDDLRAIAGLRSRHRFWLHVDGAFGALAAASPRRRHLVDGLETADSVTVDAHKWLNVPYDAALLFTRHLAPQGETFRNVSPYLPAAITPDSFANLTPENSQRLRALATWMTLVAYGRDGHAALVERTCELAARLGEAVSALPGFALLAPVRLNGVIFAAEHDDGTAADAERTAALLRHVQASGDAFLTPSRWFGRPALRASFSNWRTQPTDVARVAAALEQARAAVLGAH